MAGSKRYLPTRRRAISSRHSLLRWLGLGLIFTLIVAGAGVGWLNHQTNQPVLHSGATIDLVVPYGTSARGVAGLVRDAGVEIDEGVFLLQARWLGVHRQLQAGVYQVEPGLTKRQFIYRLAGMDPTTTSLRIVEGWTVRQVIEAAAKNTDLAFDVPAFRKPAELAKYIGAPANHPEGWIYPDLYVVKKGSTVSELLQRAVKHQQTILADAWAKRASSLPYASMEEALIIASIVEKETQFPGDRERVAAVFANRIRLGMPLQADPTVIYGLGDRFKGDITKAHLRQDTPYNTYTRKRLPPTPISNPGVRAMRAVMNPANTKAIFFVARGDGSSEFSETYEQHNSAVNRFIRGLKDGI
jgi:UPF0755 protein